MWGNQTVIQHGKAVFGSTSAFLGLTTKSLNVPSKIMSENIMHEFAVLLSLSYGQFENRRIYVLHEVFVYRFSSAASKSAIFLY